MTDPAMLRGYYFITDAGLSKAGNDVDVRNAVSAGVGVIQYRNKQPQTRILYEEALRLKCLCTTAMFIVNDRIDIALAVDADGVHLGQDDMPCSIARKMLGRDRIIGITVHSDAEARNAEAAGADYLGVSPLFPTHTKPDAGAAVGLSFLSNIRSVTRLPVIAIGGITLENALQVVRAGATGLCALSAVVTKDDVASAIRQFQEFFT